MIRSTVTFRIAPGKNVEAMEYFGQIARLIKNVTDTDVRILTRLGGPMGQIVLSSSFNDLNAWDAMRTKLQADPGFQKKTTEAGNAGLFIPGSVESALWHEA